LTFFFVFPEKKKILDRLGEKKNAGKTSCHAWIWIIVLSPLCLTLTWCWCCFVVVSFFFCVGSILFLLFLIVSWCTRRAKTLVLCRPLYLLACCAVPSAILLTSVHAPTKTEETWRDEGRKKKEKSIARQRGKWKPCFRGKYKKKRFVSRHRRSLGWPFVLFISLRILAR